MRGRQTLATLTYHCLRDVKNLRTKSSTPMWEYFSALAIYPYMSIVQLSLPHSPYFLMLTSGCCPAFLPKTPCALRDRVMPLLFRGMLLRLD